jgi:signal transduction histidine kinase/CheY-like chemotaxis protein/HAMP domain-containing protein
MNGKSLLSRVLLVVVIALLPGLALQIYTDRQDRRTRNQLMEDQVLRSLRVITDAEQRIVDGSALVLAAISASPAVQDQNPPACRRLLANIVANAPRYEVAALLAPDGQRVCGSGTIDPHVVATDRPYFQRALETGAFAVGDYAVGRSSGKPSLHFAQPVRGSGGVVTGVVMISLSLDWLQTQLEGLPLPEGTAASILDRNGTVLAQIPAEAGMIGGKLPEQKRSVLQGADLRITHAVNRLGRDQLVAYEPPGAGPSRLAVVVGVDAATAYASITEGNGLRLWLIVTTGVLALLLTVLLGRRLINRPVARLLETAERWRAGDLSARIELRQDFSDFGRLAAAFDSMAATLQAREHALNTALESTLDAVVVFDRNWRFVYMNAHAKAMNGCDRTGRVMWEDTPEAVGTPIAAALLEAVRTGKPTQVDGWVITQQRYLQINAYPSANGLTVFYRDLTEERRTAAALRESEARLREVTAELREAHRIARLGNWQYDVASTMSVASDEVRRILGLDPEAPLPRLNEQRGTIYPDQAWEAVNAGIGRAMATGEAFDLDVPARRGPEPIWVNVRGEAIRGPDGAVAGLRGTVQDITERRRLEDELRSLTRTLEVRIEQEVAAREAAQVRAAQAERIQALGQLAGGIAHDFNNVLQATMGGLSLIERRPNDHEGVRRFARLAREACERGASITRRLLSFAHRGELRAGLVDVADLLAGLQEILSHTLGAGIEVTVDVAENLRPAFADRSQLETVLVNLATNARDAMPAGGRLVFSARAEMRPMEGPPDPSGLPTGAYLRISVADTGHGMDAATLARAAEPFFTTKGLGEGTGLGLSMAKGFAEQSGGALTIASTLGLGTTITLWLPEAAPSSLSHLPAHGPAWAPEQEQATPRKRVLLVDDQDSVREILAAQLHDAGFDVVSAAGGAQAIAMLSTGLKVDALVSDLSMPQIDGLAVIKSAQQQLPQLPAILLTGYAGDDAALAVSGAIRGSFSLLRKPVDAAHLVDRLSTLLAAADSVPTARAPVI